MEQGDTSDTEQGDTSDTEQGDTSDTEQGDTSDTEQGDTSDTEQGDTSDTEQGDTSDTEQGDTSDTEQGDTSDTEQGDTSDMVRVDDHDTVRVLTLDRPDKLNAFTAAGYRALTARLDEATADPRVHVCVLTGSGRAFSAGVDLTEMGRPGGPVELGAGFAPLLAALAAFPKPLLAAVNGLAVGFGATILLHCDLVVVDERAEIRMPFIRLGTCAEAGSSWLLPRRVGAQRAFWMVMSGAPVAAAEAVAAGLAFATAPAGRAFAETLVLARQIAVHRLPALLANKRLLRAGWAESIDEVWARESAVMKELAVELGSIGWSGAGRPDAPA